MSDNDGFDGPDETGEFFREILETYSHRQAHPLKDIPVHRERVQKLVEHLLDIEARTHPQNPNPGDKELDSISALSAAERLVGLLAGWAMDHRAGMILSSATVFPWPEDDLEAPARANTEHPEKVGSAYLRDSASRSPQQDRRIVDEITARAALLPSELRDDFSQALKAVDMGELRALLSPPKGQRDRVYTDWKLRLRAIEHAYFLWGCGFEKTKGAAFREVANQYHVSYEAVDFWERGPDGLLRHFGSAALAVAIDTAKQSGERLQSLQMLLHRSELDEERIRFLLLAYGPEALARNAQEFTNTRKSSPVSEPDNP